MLWNRGSLFHCLIMASYFTKGHATREAFRAFPLKNVYFSFIPYDKSLKKAYFINATSVSFLSFSKGMYFKNFLKILPIWYGFHWRATCCNCLSIYEFTKDPIDAFEWIGTDIITGMLDHLIIAGNILLFSYDIF